LQYSAAFADRLAKISSKDSYQEIVESLLGLLGRSESNTPALANGAVSVVGGAAQPKPNAIAYAWYETTGDKAVNVKAFIRPSVQGNDRFTFENSLGEEEHGTKEEIAQKFASFDRTLILRNYRRTHHMTSDPAFGLV